MRERKGVFMSALKKAAIIALGTMTTGLYLAAPAGADPNGDPCRSLFIPICRFLPIMPDLDQDIDLTELPGGTNAGQGGQGAGTQHDGQDGLSAPDTQPGPVHSGGSDAGATTGGT
jgi:hypothetical protein